MFPIRDNIPSRTTPFVTYALIAANALVFLYEYSLGGRADYFMSQYAMIPARIAAGHPGAWRGLFTAMFVHAGWMHIIGNMWMLWIFGDNVEDRLGHGRYLGLYLIWGLAANMLHLITSWGSVIPTVGASGAIAGVMGAYIIFFPRARILTLIFIFFFIQFVDIPAVLFLGIWFVIQVLSGTVGLIGGSLHTGGVAWWAHIGGFAAGAIVARAILLRSPRLRYASMWR